MESRQHVTGYCYGETCQWLMGSSTQGWIDRWVTLLNYWGFGWIASLFHQYHMDRVLDISNRLRKCGVGFDQGFACCRT
ncbi:hypothetical protein SAMN05421690_104512 [Nitrosomonas sp. Nm51]|uniref:hypothetical protein n=1 Tax=Nitrosomonas sp. Nm51 TaxID=133720 RepID=UPI0008C83C2E|nr:hypothetical protein [Nitrosomonas sp. Nm51]SER62155.1 hypothetical protein SAMN05421690_104512 [Nitrosomonas sp. Nm51]